MDSWKFSVCTASAASSHSATRLWTRVCDSSWHTLHIFPIIWNCWGHSSPDTRGKTVVPSSSDTLYSCHIIYVISDHALTFFSILYILASGLLPCKRSAHTWSQDTRQTYVFPCGPRFIFCNFCIFEFIEFTYRFTIYFYYYCFCN